MLLLYKIFLINLSHLLLQLGHMCGWHEGPPEWLWPQACNSSPGPRLLLSPSPLLGRWDPEVLFLLPFVLLDWGSHLP